MQSAQAFIPALLTRSSCTEPQLGERLQEHTAMSARQKQFIGAPASVRYAASAAFPHEAVHVLADNTHHWSSSLTNARGSTSVVARMPEVGPLVMSAPRRWRSGKTQWSATTKGRWDSPAHTEHRRVDRKEARRSELPPHATPVWPRLL
ncbi:unnamed protein product [Trichogramma brassicae]|uniref:Uncharacterized protein n=1 Tax=Trichogramma brassicae TaxID=86971 RepID=A0A6H5HXQ8_9HYME|nr:unnamed protein product [Trichogramma brassicae]